jgi:trimeric autotransporter adhesin
MANTTIQLKYSTTTATPTSLNVAEPAYSYSSNTLFIGSPAGTGSIAIGGKFYLDQQATIYTRGNSAFDAANSAGSYANAAFAAANTAALSTGAYAQANAAFNTANAAFLQANTPSYTANSAASYAYSGFAVANSAASYANAAFSAANTASSTGTSAGSYANSAFIAANAAFLQANTPDYVANSAASYANSAFTRANNSINANTGGTITADLVITGNLTVQGNTTYINTQTITTGDSLIRLANNNTVSDTVDIGFYGAYNSSGVKYTGLVRQAGANYFLFKDLTSDPTSNVLAPGSVTAANTGTLTANLTSYSVTINGQDINQFATNAYAQANTAATNATSAGSYGNSAFAVANSAASYANSGFIAANSGFAVANSAASYGNSAFAVANSAASYANSAFATANNNAGVNTTQNNSITAAFAAANASFLVANGAAFVANTDYTNLTISAGNYGTASAVASFKVEANGRISSANNTSIAIDVAAITSGTLGVPRGGTGAGTFTNNGVLLGQGTSAFATASSSTEGHVLTINSSGVPTFSHLQGGTF